MAADANAEGIILSPASCGAMKVNCLLQQNFTSYQHNSPVFRVYISKSSIPTWPANFSTIFSPF